MGIAAALTLLQILPDDGHANHNCSHDDRQLPPSHHLSYVTNARHKYCVLLFAMQDATEETFLPTPASGNTSEQLIL